MSSSAFFIEAAANTVMVLSSAAAGEDTAPSEMTKAAKIAARRYIVALRPCLQARNPRAAMQALTGQGCDNRKRRSGDSCDLRSVRNIAPMSLQHCSGGAKAPRLALLLRVGCGQHRLAGRGQCSHRH